MSVAVRSELWWNEGRLDSCVGKAGKLQQTMLATISLASPATVTCERDFQDILIKMLSRLCCIGEHTQASCGGTEKKRKCHNLLRSKSMFEDANFSFVSNSLQVLWPTIPVCWGNPGQVEASCSLYRVPA